MPSTNPRAQRGKPTRVVVIGAGAAGCVVAARLAQAGFAVTLVEGGPDRDPNDAAAPINSADLFRAATAQGHVTTVMARSGQGEATWPYVRGVGVGGSGAVNGLLLHRGTPEDYENWAALPGCEGWGSGELWPRLERRYNAGHTYERRGPIDMLLQESLPVDAARFAIDSTGKRACSAATDLAQVRSIITVRTAVQVEKVLFDAQQCVGVKLTSGEVIDADLVVLSAGTVQSPLLLQRSGVDRPGVGQNLHDHPAISVALPLAEPTSLDIAPTTMLSHALSAGSLPHVQVLPLNRTGIDDAARSVGALMVGVMGQHARGHIWTSKSGDVVLELNHDTDERDRAGLRFAASLAHRVLTGSTNRSYRELVPNPNEASDVIDAWVATHRGQYYHAAGTCRMGASTDDLSVVDNACQVIGTRGLYVVDASILPNQPRTSPYLATLAVAELAAERIASSVS